MEQSFCEILKFKLFHKFLLMFSIIIIIIIIIIVIIILIIIICLVLLFNFVVSVWFVSFSFHNYFLLSPSFYLSLFFKLLVVIVYLRSSGQEQIMQLNQNT